VLPFYEDRCIVKEKEGIAVEKLDILKQWVNESCRIVFLGGAGVSTESGIPDFRGVDGLYKQKFDYPPETIISYDFFVRNPAYFYRFYREKMMPIGYEPNITHKKLAQWEQEGKLQAVVTQNIDGLHQKAGSRRVLELHGTLQRNYCLRCGKVYPPQFVKDSEGVPKCSCGGTVRPDIVMYQERLDPDVVESSIAAIESADLLIVGGTSLTVYPAAGLIDYYRGQRLVLINRDETSYDHRANLIFHHSLGEIFSQL
jgi:NAD-dependent deacetylase